MKNITIAVPKKQSLDRSQIIFTDDESSKNSDDENDDEHMFNSQASFGEDFFEEVEQMQLKKSMRDER